MKLIKRILLVLALLTLVVGVIYRFFAAFTPLWLDIALGAAVGVAGLVLLALGREGPTRE